MVSSTYEKWHQWVVLRYKKAMKAGALVEVGKELTKVL